jgi:hypothetical protein
MEEANRQHQMEIQGQTRGLLNTINTIISFKKSKRAKRRGIGRLQHKMREQKHRVRRVHTAAVAA